MSEAMDGRLLKAALAAGTAQVARGAEGINALNVFPVPDGDTGTNMRHTLHRAFDEIAAHDSKNASVIAKSFAQGALMGARGNSGTILSQLLGGFADALGDAPVLTPMLLRDAAGSAVERAYAAVAEPTEGTILTVAREAAESLAADNLHDATTTQLMNRAVCAARESLAKTPDLLPILREAGVVDAGGMGLLCFLQGMTRGNAGDLPELALAKPTPRQAAKQPGDYGYDVQFLMRGSGLDVTAVRRDMGQLGWSVLVVGGGAAIKVHIHAHNPAPPLDYAVKTGAELDDIVVENMSLQAQAFQSQQTQHGTAVIAAADGDGFLALLRDLGCHSIIDSSAGSPAAEEILAAVNRQPHGQVIVLPNDKNAILAAEQAVQLAKDKQAVVIPTRSVQQGISAMLAWGSANDTDASLDETLSEMRLSSESVLSIAVARASRSAQIQGTSIRQGEYIAMVDGQIRAAASDIFCALHSVLHADVDADHELVTLYYGAGMTAEQAQDLLDRLKSECGGLEYEAVFGGQRSHPVLVSIE
ncbi:MAG: DAK2 domain-containing protein [Chloroflexi bacterium]|nr:DAK2 domain-containing protein [Chloroflexota bacterium]